MSTPVVILCGGKGTRLRQSALEIPKALMPIGDMPILLHIMNIYAHHGFKDFILCLGYKAPMIERYFRRGLPERRGWRVKCVDTGLETNTAGRIKRALPFIPNQDFFATYGDGLSNVDIAGLLKYHKRHGRVATMTCVKPRIQFGVAILSKRHQVTAYVEKPVSAKWVNGGFFVFKRGVSSYMKGDEVLEQQPFSRLTKAGQLMAYPFDGFWACMDTYKDNLTLNDLWARGEAAWRVWK